MAKYIDGFVLSVPKDNIDAYTKMSKDTGKIWKKYGALQYVESVAEDLKPEKITFTFDKMAKTKPEEVTVFSFVVYKSRKHRDQVNAKAMKDPMMEKYASMVMPFNMKRMAHAGFASIVDL